MKKRKINRFSILILVFGLLITYGCNYYKPMVNSSSSSATKTKEIADLGPKTFIVRSNRGDFLLKNVDIRLEEEQLVGMLDSVPKQHRSYINDTKSKYKYKPGDPSVLREVHLYTILEDGAELGEKVTIPISNIAKMETIQRDKSRSTTNTILTGVGVTVGALAVVVTIAAIETSKDTSPYITNPEEGSCPFVSVYDGKEFVFQGEAFGGALFPTIARQDYLPLPAMAVGSEVKLEISNERKEHQYIDFADLLLVEHEPGDKILVDPKGRLMLVKDTKKPISAILNNNRDMIDRITELDNKYCSFNDVTHSSSRNELIAKFDNPGGDKNLSLVLNLRDSPWLEHIFGEFISKYGEQYEDWMATLKTKSAKELDAWQENHLVPLTISVKTNGGWTEVTKAKFVGPVMNRELAISLEGIDLVGSEIEVSFQTGFLYWEIDKIALAEVEMVSPRSVNVLKPSLAVDEKGKNVMSDLSELDGKFMEQPEIGNSARLTYHFKEYSKEKSYSAFFHTSGYYVVDRKFEGPLDEAFLTKYDKPEGLSNFSMRRYLEISQYANAGK